MKIIIVSQFYLIDFSGSNMEKGKLGTILNSRLDLPEKIKFQPWYKERLDSKYAQHFTDTSSWTFLKNGMDDYRDGNPPKLDSSIVSKKNKEIKPILACSDLYNRKKLCQRINKKLDPYDILYSKNLPNQRKRMEHVKKIEESILKGPLAYSPEQNDLPEKVIQDVCDILNISNSKADDSLHSLKLQDGVLKSNSSLSERNLADEYTRRAYTLYKKKSSSFNSSEECDSDEKLINIKPLPNEMDQVDLVTMEFCDWVKGIGGEGNNVEEDTIKELFVCAYEGDPSTSAVQTMNLSTIPSELLADASQSRYTCIKRNVASRGATKPCGNKIKYGAWYLSPQSWKARPANTMLEDERKKEEDIEPLEKREEIDKLLPTLHSAQTFLHFSLDKNFIRKPKLLGNVEINGNPLKGNRDQQNSLTNISS